MPSSSTHKLNDLPIRTTSEDLLGLESHAVALAKFIKDCETPITIGIQGEWGTGKTSMMEMIKDQLGREEVGQGRGRKMARGDEAFALISINTWEHSLINDPTGCLLSITEEITTELYKIEGSLNLVQAKQTIMRMAAGAASLGSVVTGGSSEALGGLMSPPNDIKTLREQLKKAVSNLTAQGREKIIVFIDDLDRLDPPTAVKTLELLSNLFAIEKCVFAIAIDYQVVVKGLVEKYGKPKADNEHEFRSFFDKLIQLPFMMPVSSYDIDRYAQALLKGTSYFLSNELKAMRDDRLTLILRATIGVNPRSIKRLTNSLSYLKILKEKEFQGTAVYEFKQTVFALVCLQISFPNVYNLLRLNHDFESWDAEFVKQVIGKTAANQVKLNDEIERIIKNDPDLFDEAWEEALFKIVWAKNWQRNRLKDVSIVLNFISDDLYKNRMCDHLDVFKDALDITAVTAVNPTDEASSPREEKDGDQRQVNELLDFWKYFADGLQGTDTCFDQTLTPISSTHKSRSLRRTKRFHDGVELEFTACLSSTNPLIIRATNRRAHHLLYQFTRSSTCRELPQDSVLTEPVDLVADGMSKITLLCPDVPERLPLQKAKNEAHRKTVLKWFASVMVDVQQELESLSIESR